MLLNPFTYASLPPHDLCNPKINGCNIYNCASCLNNLKMSPKNNQNVGFTTTDSYLEVSSVTAFENPSYWKLVANEMHGKGMGRTKMHVGGFRY